MLSMKLHSRLRINILAPVLCLPFVWLTNGCAVSGNSSSGSGGNPPGSNPPPPASTVTFQPASTQQWLQQLSLGRSVPGPAGQAQLGGSIVNGVAVDSQGVVVVANENLGALTNPAPIINEVAVVQFDFTGKQMWTQQITTNQVIVVYAIAADANGNIAVGGFTSGAFPGYSNPSGAQESFVLKLNPAGQTLWVQQLEQNIAAPDQVNSLAFDSAGNIVAGIAASASGTNASTGDYIAKLDGATGTIEWQQSNIASGITFGVTGVAVDNAGNVFAVGSFPGTGPSASTLFNVAKLSGATGGFLWQQVPITQGSTTRTQYTTVAMDHDNNAVIGGVYLTGSFGTACAVGKLSNQTGTMLWQQQFGAAADCTPGNVATDSAGDVLMSGNVSGALRYFSNYMRQDVFLVKLDTNGNGVWVQEFGNVSPPGDEVPQGTTTDSALVFVAIDSQNNAYVAGTTTGAFSGFSNPNYTNELFVTRFGP